MKVRPDTLKDMVNDIARHHAATRFTPALLEKAWRYGVQGFSHNVQRLARDRCERLEKAGLVDVATGPRGGKGWVLNAKARSMFPAAFRHNA